MNNVQSHLLQLKTITEQHIAHKQIIQNIIKNTLCLHIPLEHIEIDRSKIKFHTSSIQRMFIIENALLLHQLFKDNGLVLSVI